MKKTITYILATLIAIVLFGGLVHAVPTDAIGSEPTVVYGPTPRRIWMLVFMALTLIGVIVGGLSQRRSRIGTSAGRIMAIVSITAGLIGVVNGVVNLATATGGPGTGNGVIGGGVAIVLGTVSLALGWIALARSNGIAKGSKI